MKPFQQTMTRVQIIGGFGNTLGFGTVTSEAEGVLSVTRDNGASLFLRRTNNPSINRNCYELVSLENGYWRQIDGGQSWAWLDTCKEFVKPEHGECEHALPHQLKCKGCVQGTTTFICKCGVCKSKA